MPRSQPRYIFDCGLYLFVLCSGYCVPRCEAFVLVPRSTEHAERGTQHDFLQRSASSKPADTTCAESTQQNGAGRRDSIGCKIVYCEPPGVTLIEVDDRPADCCSVVAELAFRPINHRVGRIVQCGCKLQRFVEKSNFVRLVYRPSGVERNTEFELVYRRVKIKRQSPLRVAFQGIALNICERTGPDCVVVSV